MSGVVIVGAGQAGFQVAASLREGGWRDPIALIGAEADLPYQRPPLSKAYLAGRSEARDLLLRPPTFFEAHAIAHRPGLRAGAVARDARRLHLSGGESLAYDHLVLATGARNRPLPVTGANLSGVHQLRTRADADALRAALEGVRRIVVVGAGFVGLEFAAVCAAQGLSVTVVETTDRIMSRTISAEAAARVQAAHEAAGILFRFRASVTALEGVAGRVSGVATADGAGLPADLVVIGIGVLPEQDLAAAAGLATGDGIEVDPFLSTADPAISAVGDCARFPSRHARGLSTDGRVRIESVQNAIDHGRCLAARLLGRPAAYDAVPWFWSDQGGQKIQIAGLSAPGDASVTRGDHAAYTVFRYRDGRLRAVETVNRPGEHMAARRILGAGLDLPMDAAADPALDLKGLAAQAPRG